MKRRDARTISRLGLPLVLALGAAMIVWTWGTWPDPLIDFGRELYVPWQLWQGKVLYRDVAHFNGPLSAYWNALLYLIFGVSLRSIVIGNLAIAACVAWMIFALFRRAGGERFSATATGLVFVMLFVPLQLVDIGNYNWVTPYSHELTHGVALSLLSLLMLAMYVARSRTIWTFACGFATGCVFLTKVEVFAAAAPTIVIGLLLSLRMRRVALRLAIRHVAMFLLGCLIPPITFVALLSLAMPLGDAFRGVIGGWAFLLDGRITQLAFYKRSMGTDEPVANARQALVQSLWYALAIAPPALLGIFIRRTRNSVWIAATYAIALLTVLLLLDSKIPWHDAFRGLTMVILAIVVASLFALVRAPRRPRALLRFVLATFALLLLGKVFLAARVYHYGFALAMPAMLVAVAAIISWLPRWIDRRGGSGLILRSAGVAAVAMVLFVHLRAYARIYHDKPLVVARGTADQFRANAIGVLVSEVSQFLSVLPPGTTVAVVPQGVMINYLSARNNPTPYVTLMPPEVLMYGDGTIAAAYAQNPPDVVVIVGADLREYGYDAFEQLAPRTAAFFRAHYTPVRSIELKDLPPATILQRKNISR